MLVALCHADPAAAFRCGSKLVKDGMHESEVIAACGEPESRRNLGYALRGIDLRSRRHSGYGVHVQPGYGHYLQEILITELIYNFGPRKLMRRLLFEGGILVEIENLGYGHR
ncbi:MAG: DUF2845 domain-containing protein [Gammaproteobacteria bacterium]|nr:DUF2845 domain-containing protein [Gammaproteobacteria bacterium]